MRSTLSFLLFCAMTLAACDNGKTITRTEKNEDGTTTTTSVDLSSMATHADDITQKMEALKNLTPLSLDELKALLPEEINGVKRSRFNANSAMGFAMAEAEYQQDDETELRLAVYDCAGEAGSGIFGMSYWTKMSMQSESDDGYTKTVSFNGDKAVETYQKGNNESSLTYVVNDRLLVTLTGHNMDASTLKNIGENLTLKP